MLEYLARNLATPHWYDISAARRIDVLADEVAALQSLGEGPLADHVTWHEQLTRLASSERLELADVASQTGLRWFALGFLVAEDPSTCTASWGTYYSLEAGPDSWGPNGQYFLYD